MVLQPLDVQLGPQRLVEADVGELGGAVVNQLVSATVTSQRGNCQIKELILLLSMGALENWWLVPIPVTM